MKKALFRHLDVGVSEVSRVDNNDFMMKNYREINRRGNKRKAVVAIGNA